MYQGLAFDVKISIKEIQKALDKLIETRRKIVLKFPKK